MKFKLKAINYRDIQKEYSAQINLKSENGFENTFSGSIDDFKAFIKSCIKASKGINLPNGYVPQTTYYLYKDDEIIGIYKIRHYCNDITKTNGTGHIGYALIKKYRGLGYSKIGLKLAIKKLIKMNDFDGNYIYMGCHKDNVPSLKCQQSCGAKIIGETDTEFITRIDL